MVNDCRTVRDVFVADRAGFDECSLGTFIRRSVRQRFDYAHNAIYGPAEIDCGWASRKEFPRRARQGHIGRVLLEGQC